MIIKKFKKTVHISIDKNNFNDYFKCDSMDDVKNVLNLKLFEYMDQWGDISYESFDYTNCCSWFNFNVNGCEYDITLTYNDIIDLIDGKTIICDRLNDPSLKKRSYRKLFHFNDIHNLLHNDYYDFHRVTGSDGEKGYRYILDKKLTADNITLLKKYDNVIISSCHNKHAPELTYDTLILLD